MSIVTSVILSDDRQHDGRRSIIEKHVDHLGNIYQYAYLALSNDNVNAILASRITTLVDWLVTHEIRNNLQEIIKLGSDATPTLKFSSIAQNSANVRAYYATATQNEAIMIGDFLNTLSNAQLQNAFNITLQQANNLRTTKLLPAANLAASIKTATGE